jgi:hypothetical protein
MPVPTRFLLDYFHVSTKLRHIDQCSGDPAVVNDHTISSFRFNECLDLQLRFRFAECIVASKMHQQGDLRNAQRFELRSRSLEARRTPMPSAKDLACIVGNLSALRTSAPDAFKQFSAPLGFGDTGKGPAVAATIARHRGSLRPVSTSTCSVVYFSINVVEVRPLQV